MTGKPKLLFIKHKDFTARTVDNDIAILSQKYNVILYNADISKNTTFVIGILKQLVYLILNIHRFNAIFIWFADYHSYLPTLFSKILKKKSILCLGGYDGHWIIPGNPRTAKEKLRKFCVVKSVKYSSFVFTVSKWLAGFMDGVVEKNKIDVAYCCIDSYAFGNSEDLQKENIILTVGGGGYLYETKRKKLDFFIEVGNYFTLKFPEYDAKFILIGHDENSETYLYLKQYIKSDKIQLLPVINNISQLKVFYQKAKIYSQFSEYEAFGISIIEAMLNKCIPIVFNGGAMPEVVGNAGIIINKYNIEYTAGLMKDILDDKYASLTEKAKQRVEENFTINHRKEILFKYI